MHKGVRDDARGQGIGNALLQALSAGRKAAGQNKVTFDVIYQPGTIEAVSYCSGKETSRTFLKTAGAPASLRLTADRETIGREYGDLGYVTVEIVDQEGCVVTNAEPKVSFEVTGAGELIAIGTANPWSEESYVGTQRKA